MPKVFHRFQDNIYDSANEEADDAPLIIAPSGGSRLTRGRTLDGEIDRYRRRVEALVHFLDRMAPQWWDKLHLFETNGEMVRRPSRSADLLRATQSRLVARLTRLTPRVIVSAAAAVVSIEEAEKVPILPSCFIRNHAWHRNTEANASNAEERLANAFALARRLGEIERLKQELILHAMDWISSDGNDLKVRLQRMESLARHIQPCLIENHEGVSAVIRHYFRRRSKPKKEVKVSADLDPLSDAKQQLKHAFSCITAENMCSTNQAIIGLLETNHKKSFQVGETREKQTGRINEMLNREMLEYSIGRSTEEVNRWIRSLTDDVDSILYPLSLPSASVQNSRDEALDEMTDASWSKSIGLEERNGGYPRFMRNGFVEDRFDTAMLQMDAMNKSNVDRTNKDNVSLSGDDVSNRQTDPALRENWLNSARPRRLPEFTVISPSTILERR